MTPAEAIERLIALRDTLKIISAEHKAIEQDYKDGIEAIQDYLLAVMLERGEKQIKCDAGVAMKMPETRVKLVDREQVIDYVRKTGNFDIFTNAVSKDFVTKWEAEKGLPPPGVEISHSIGCNVRKS